MNKSTVRADDTEPDLSRALQAIVEEKTAAITERAMRGHKQLDAEDALTHHARLVLDNDEYTARTVREMLRDHLDARQDCPFCEGSNTAGPSEVGQNTQCPHCGPSGQIPLYPHELGEALKQLVEGIAGLQGVEAPDSEGAIDGVPGGTYALNPMATEILSTALGWVDWVEVAASYIEDMSAEVKALKEVAMSTEHLDFVATVDIASRENSLYVFERRRDAERLAQAVRSDSGPDSGAFVSEQPVNTGEAAERLIAAERADVLADLGWGAVAEDIREGVPVETVAGRLAESTLAPHPLNHQVQEWIELDRQGGPRMIPALALQAGQRVKAPGARAWSTIRSVELDEQVTARLAWGSLVYEPGELVEVAEQAREVECPLCASNDVTELEQEHYCEACRHYFA